MALREKKRTDELEKYRKALDDILKNLTKLREIKRSKVNFSQVVVGIITLALGGVLLLYSVSADVFRNQRLTILSIGGIFAGISMLFLGYIISHRGFTGHWL